MLGILLSSAGCAIMPSSGPEDHVIKSEITRSGPDYVLVKLTPTVVDILKEYGPGAIAGSFPDRRPPPGIRFGIGDTVAVSIFEAAAGGLFIPAEAGVRPGNFVALPNQNVDLNGNITVPYAGQVKANGRTPTDIQRDIVKAIGNRAIEPQVVVSLITQNTSLISVLGEVRTPARLTANAAGERVLDLIARAGGLTGPGWESWVTLERGGKRATVPFGALVYQPANNVWVHPGDTIYVYREPQVFLAFGAFTIGGNFGGQAQFPFDMWKITMAQAMAKAGGLIDAQAEPAGVYVYRREPRELVERLGVDCSRFTGPLVPVVYNADFRDPSGFFLASKFEMRDKDVLFAANAATVDTTKFLTFVQAVVGTANSTIVAANNAQILRINSRQ
ncbi:polysaccharide biosynthesis/export family protein [Bradyrhizobium sp. ISRA443]|uniref:polysaccharide biosynthesis/export family protein n=1 Tax=unclassified Bradyrhizobium TaxID=2631580 RepID=UPI0024799E0A|nr:MULTISPECIES: polysaccharide biosynthesis/export family protein [unclassified Bradyrhizobium]WGR92813.1 polysaccharide biosynthesis/export family protein [Bradyrhizobium sp. ISRA435]WGR97282.1 polysaccharide biosynthesis/export family protein [Bradyrhizobium sp. ISRA436]WGS04171.1 polysaccharide biosynthesis/export family protein [Bradyrhizobium sp. ISRA437]WGS11054.1 polysaccharide biosynthesis/export family protein [Bradyrhizobium sp. ISRA443]